MATPDYMPTVDAVAALERTRTVGPDVGGLGGDTDPQELTTFDETTRPTAAEVEALIVPAAAAIVQRLGPDIVDVLNPAISHAIALYTAILIEGSYFDGDNPQVALWERLLDGLMTGLEAATNSETAGIAPSGVDSIVLRGTAVAYDAWPYLPEIM